MRSDLSSWTIRGMGFGIGVAIVLGIVQLGIAAADVLLLVFGSILVASALEPIVDRLRDRLPLGRSGSILLVYVAFFAIVLTAAFIVVPAVINQASQVIAGVPPFLGEVRSWAVGLYPTALSTSVTALVDSLAAVFAPAPPPDPDEVVEVGTAVAERAVALAMLLTIVFFWLLEHARIQRYALAYLPAHRRAGVRDAWNEIETRLGLWVHGQLLLMAAVGLATGVTYVVLGLPGALLLALIAGLAEAIPIVGPLVGAVPAILVAATVSPETAVLVGLIYLVIQLLEGSVLVPMVMRNTVGLSPLLVVVSLLVGSTVGGVTGAFLAVPLVAAVEIILSRLQARETRVAQDAAGVDIAAADSTADAAADPGAAGLGKALVPAEAHLPDATGQAIS